MGRFRDLDMDVLNEQIEREIARRKRSTRLAALLVNIALFIVIMGVAWTMALTNTSVYNIVRDPGDTLFFALFLPTLGWFVAVLFHAYATAMEFGLLDRLYERTSTAKAVEATLLTEARQHAKRKRRLVESDAEDDEALLMDDDGELAAGRR